MSTTTQRPTLGLPPRQPVPSPQSVTITSQVVYMKGPWGSSKPVRTFGNVDVFARHHFTHLGGGITEEHIGSALLDGEGHFTITTSALPVTTVDVFLRIEELFSGNIFNFQLLDPKNPAMDRFERNRVGKQYVSNDVGNDPRKFHYRIRVPWPPPRPEIAYVNSTKLVDTHKLARRLSDLLAAPAYPMTITLINESSSGYPGGDHTEAAGMFQSFTGGNVPADFPVRLARALGGVSHFGPAASLPPARAMAWVLDRFVTLNITMLETTKVLNETLLALGKALGRITSNTVVSDAAPDTAVACSMVFMAGLMARDNAKVTVSYGAVNFAEMQTRHFNAVFLSIDRK
jgi:hypothetical protein